MQQCKPLGPFSEKEGKEKTRKMAYKCDGRSQQKNMLIMQKQQAVQEQKTWLLLPAAPLLRRKTFCNVQEQGSC
eukprot:12154411-Ditylum_brightwellii.AAC.1